MDILGRATQQTYIYIIVDLLMLTDLPVTDYLVKFHFFWVNCPNNFGKIVG
jgi:hypothetical protein